MRDLPNARMLGHLMPRTPRSADFLAGWKACRKAAARLLDERGAKIQLEPSTAPDLVEALRANLDGATLRNVRSSATFDAALAVRDLDP